MCNVAEPDRILSIFVTLFHEAAVKN